MAALADTAQGRIENARDHIAEAADVASRPEVGDGNFMHMWFSRGNVGMWETMLAVEAGEGGKTVEIARSLNPTGSRRRSHGAACASWLVWMTE
ncbi:hypothetical protein [Pseudonocardia spinosispora]|uniref:hypothetical protein n=1 Tax=Pseudonocardia spinosispora TaxID=103441 RepID=UPI0012EC4777|nr:hypothetical protein [Pseudonocardia spinosispora]